MVQSDLSFGGAQSGLTQLNGAGHLRVDRRSVRVESGKSLTQLCGGLEGQVPGTYVYRCSGNPTT